VDGGSEKWQTKIKEQIMIITPVAKKITQYVEINFHF
jgi:hypothetical protein